MWVNVWMDWVFCSQVALALVTASSPSFLCAVTSAPNRTCAPPVYTRVFSILWWTNEVGHWSALDHSQWLLYHLPTRDDKFVSCVDYSLCFDGQPDSIVIFHRDQGLLVDIVTCVCERCRLSSLRIDVTWSRDSEQPCHQSAVDWNLRVLCMA